MEGREVPVHEAVELINGLLGRLCLVTWLDTTGRQRVRRQLPALISNVSGLITADALFDTVVPRAGDSLAIQAFVHGNTSLLFSARVAGEELGTLQIRWPEALRVVATNTRTPRTTRNGKGALAVQA